MSYTAKNPQFNLYPSDRFLGDGVTTVFTLKTNVIGNNSILVWVNGLKLSPTAYNVNGDLLTIFTPPPAPPVQTPPILSNVEVFYLNVTNTEGVNASGVTEIDIESLVPTFTFTGGPITTNGTIFMRYTGGNTAIPVSGGGTGVSTIPTNSILIGNGQNPIGTINPTNTPGFALISNAIGPASFQPVVLSVDGGNSGLTFTTAAGVASITAGTMFVNRGGTGASSLANNQLLLGQGTSAIAPLAPPATAGLALTSSSAGAAPTWTQLPVVDPTFASIGSLIFGGPQTGVNLAVGATFIATVGNPLIVYGLGTAPSVSYTTGSWQLLGAINTTEEGLFWRTA